MRLPVPRLFDGLLDGVTYGTGWLIAPGVVITNHHVIDARDKQQGEPDAAPADFRAQAEQVEAWFDHTQEIGGNPLKCNGVKLLDSDKTLDYAIIELTEASKVADRSPLRLIRQAPALAPETVPQEVIGGQPVEVKSLTRRPRSMRC
jgi:endonuclease G, mitochondrial